MREGSNLLSFGFRQLQGDNCQTCDTAGPGGCDSDPGSCVSGYTPASGGTCAGKPCSLVISKLVLVFHLYW